MIAGPLNQLLKNLKSNHALSNHPEMINFFSKDTAAILSVEGRTFPTDIYYVLR